tara:strand:- start:912 stop:1193 length:282 start_codon:yes stop_codon:yes gene_type:complete
MDDYNSSRFHRIGGISSNNGLCSLKDSQSLKYSLENMIRIVSLIIIVVLVISGGFWVFNKAFEKLPSKSIIVILSSGVILGVVGTFVFFNIYY